MSGYIETELYINPYDADAADILSALLAESGYDSFADTESGVKCYVREEIYSGGAVENAIESLPIKSCTVTYENRFIEDQDWNSRWVEESFTPITIGKECIIHSPKHAIPEGIKYDILIAPKMAFGSGHHETTHMMAEWIIHENIQDKTVLDMGCGTGILAILASKCGAAEVTAIDIDERSYNNTIENSELNGIGNIIIRLGGADSIGDDKFDIILANINRNILIADMAVYSSAIIAGGALYLSGFYESDIDILSEAAAKEGFTKSATKNNGEWVSVKYIKINHK